MTAPRTTAPKVSRAVTGALALLALGATTAGCASWPGLEDPTVEVAPSISLLRVTGDTQMQNRTDNTFNPQTIEDLGGGKRDEELGARLAYGDGFSGFDASYLLLDMESTERGRALENWGAIDQGMTVNSRMFMDEIRVRYIAELFDYTDEDEENWFKAGAGIQLMHREMNFTVFEVDGDGRPTGIDQKIEIKDHVSPMLAIRLAAERKPFSLVLDYAVNDDWSVGVRDFDKRFYDFELRAEYTLEDQELVLFGGYRRFNITSRGHEAFLEYRTDFTFDGLHFGFEFEF